MSHQVHHCTVTQIAEGTRGGYGGAFLNIANEAFLGHANAVGVWGFAAGTTNLVVLARNPGTNDFALIVFRDRAARDYWLAAEHPSPSFRDGYELTWISGAPQKTERAT